MPTTMFSGSIAPVLQTYHILGTIPSSGIYTYKMETGGMRNGDEIELRVADSVGAGTVSCLYLASYAHQQANSVKISPPFVVEAGGGHVSIVQRAGTSRTFYYSVLSI